MHLSHGSHRSRCSFAGSLALESQLKSGKNMGGCQDRCLGGRCCSSKADGPVKTGAVRRKPSYRLDGRMRGQVPSRIRGEVRRSSMTRCVFTMVSTAEQRAVVVDLRQVCGPPPKVCRPPGKCVCVCVTRPARRPFEDGRGCAQGQGQGLQARRFSDSEFRVTSPAYAGGVVRPLSTAGRSPEGSRSAIGPLPSECFRHAASGARQSLPVGMREGVSPEGFGDSAPCGRVCSPQRARECLATAHA